MNPLVSIIVPCYNRAAYLGETLDSILNQTYQNWECIVIDDRSQDYTRELMEFYTKKNSRIKYYLRPKELPRGANTCRNLGFNFCKGTYINWLDSDDLIRPKKIEKQIDSLAGKDKYAIATSYWNFLDGSEMEPQKDLKVFRSFKDPLEFIDALALSGGFLPPHSYLLSREIIIKAGSWLENLKINQDGEFFSRIFINASEIIFSPDSKVLYRKTENERVSNLNSSEKINHAIFSWNLIENRFHIKFGHETRLVTISKKYLYQKLLKENPSAIQENLKFFNDQHKKMRLKTRIISLVNKMKSFKK